MNYDHGTQVGGDHYNQGDKPQHWDLVVMYDWDYFQGQVIKYLMRWKTKYNEPSKKLEDLKKARNFLDKYIQEEEQRLQPVGYNKSLRDELLTSYRAGGDGGPVVQAAVMGYAQFERPINVDLDWQVEGFYGDETNLYRHKESGKIYRTHGLDEAKTAMKAGDPPYSGATPTAGG